MNSPIFFNIELEAVFRESDELCNEMKLFDDIKLRCTVCDNLAFTDDVTEMVYYINDLSHRL